MIYALSRFHIITLIQHANTHILAKHDGLVVTLRKVVSKLSRMENWLLRLCSPTHFQLCVDGRTRG